MHICDSFKNECRKRDGNERTHFHGDQKCRTEPEHHEANHAQQRNQPYAHRGSDGSAAKKLQHKRRVKEGRRITAYKDASLIAAEIRIAAQVLSPYAFNVENSLCGIACRGTSLIVAKKCVCDQVLSPYPFSMNKSLRGNTYQVSSLSLLSPN